MADFLENIKNMADPIEAEFTANIKKGKAIKVKSAKKPEKKVSQSLFEQEGELTVDVFETEKNIIIQSAVGGINSDELEISIERDMVSIRGKRERKTEEETKNYFCQECYWGKFSREIILPMETDTSKADAIIKNGVLTITIPKITKEKNKKLDIKEIE